MTEKHCHPTENGGPKPAIAVSVRSIRLTWRSDP